MTSEQQTERKSPVLRTFQELEPAVAALVRTVHARQQPVMITYHGQFLVLIDPVNGQAMNAAVELTELRALRDRVEEAADPNGPPYTKDSMPVSYVARRLLRGRGWPVQVTQPTAAEPFPVGTPVCLAGVREVLGEVVEPTEVELTNRSVLPSGEPAPVLVEWHAAAHSVRWWHHQDELSLVDNENDHKEPS